MKEMIYFCIVLCMTVLAFSGLVLYHMHMYQLNSYANDEQCHWMKNNYNSLLGRMMGILLSVLILLPAGHTLLGVLVAGYLMWLTYHGNRPQKGMAKKDFVYTKRVIRMLVTIGILFFLFVVAAIVLYAVFANNLAYLPLLAGCLLTTPIMFLANRINRPIEKKINRGFVEDAMNIVASMPALTTIGITGSFGKTSMKHFLTKLLSADFNTYMTPGNFNTELGVTIAVRRDLKPIHEIFVCEMGARRVGEIKAVCDIAKPAIGVLTSIGPQHLETFGSMDNIIHTKFELSDALPAGPKGVLFVNYDNEILKNEAAKTGHTIISYGINDPDAMYRPENIHCTEQGCEFDIMLKNKEYVHIISKVIGEHNVLNLAGAIACADHLGVSPAHMVAQAKRLEPVAHRLQMIKSPRGIIIDDAYNSNPTGAKAALDTLDLFDGLKVVVTPGMIELGEKQEECNYTFGTQIARVADYIALVGKKQTAPIKKGVVDVGFDPKKLFVVSDLKEAMACVDAITTNERKIILLENDLPDNY